MRIDSPRPAPREAGDYKTSVTIGYGDPRGDIHLDEAGALRLSDVRPEDCDRLIKAAAEIKSRVLAHRAEMAAPHGRRYVYQGTCQLCGKPEDDALHAPERCDSRPYPAGSEGDDGTECVLPKGHDGDHDDGVVITAPADPGWRDERTGLMSGPTYKHLNRLSCGCTFAGPLTWPAGRKAHCDAHGAVTTAAVALPGDDGELPAPDGADALLAAAALDIEMREAASGMQDPAPVVRVTGGELPAPAGATGTEDAR